MTSTVAPDGGPGGTVATSSPSDTTRKGAETEPKRSTVVPARSLPATTTDGHTVEIAANIYSRAANANGVELQRAGRLPDAGYLFQVARELVPANAAAELGSIWFSPVMQRTRAATEAMFLMMQRAFELGYRRYEWKCDALNTPSRAAATR